MSAGTSKPISAEVVADHSMHVERIGMSVSDLDDIAASVAAGRPIVAVGTTSARTLESLYWLGVRRMRESSSNDGEALAAPELRLGKLEQWPGYSLDKADEAALPPPEEVLAALAAEARGLSLPTVGGSTKE